MGSAERSPRALRPGSVDILILIAGLYFLVLAILSAWVLSRYSGETKQPGYSVVYSSDGVRIRALASPRFGEILREGDRVLAVDNDPRAAVIGPFFRLYDLAPGAPYALSVVRSGQLHGSTIFVQVQSQEGPGLWYRLSLLLAAVAFAGTSMVLVVLAPKNRLVRLGAVANLSGALLLTRTALTAVKYSLSGWEHWIYFATTNISPVHLAIGFSFFSRFPRGRQSLRFARWAELLLYGTAVPLALSADLLERATTQPGLAGSPLLLWSRVLQPVYMASIEAVSLTAFVLICLTLLFNYRRIGEPMEKRRAQWVVFGCIFGLAPWALWEAAVLLLRLTTGENEIPPGFFRVSGQLSSLAIGVIPIVIGIAIAKDRLLEVNTVVRQGLQYLLAKSVLQAALATPVAVLSVLVYLGRHRTLFEIIFQNSALFYISASSALGLLFRKQLQDWLDRRFFRSSYDREKLITSLAEDIRDAGSPELVADLVIRRLDEALHPAEVLVLVAPVKEAEPRIFSSAGIVRPNPAIARLLLSFEKVEGPMFITAGRRPDGEEDPWLSRNSIELAVPLRPSRTRLSGLLLLGPRLSDEPYGESDRELLEVLGTQMAMVFENLALKQDVELERTAKLRLIQQFTERGDVVKECPRCGRCFDADGAICSFDGSPLQLSLPVSRLIDKRYRLDRLIGRGGMGAVYEATDHRLDRSVAIKVAVGDAFTKREVQGRFEREARACARLNHPNITAVFDYGTIAGRGAYLVMELVNGRTLRTELSERGLLPPAETSRLLEQLLSGLLAAHTNGVIHRDLKPENIILSPDPEGRTALKILDFGLAKTSFFDFTQPASLTTPGMAVGTAGYMSPEQIYGEEVDLRTDLFSAGVLAFEMLTGRLPFRGTTVRELMMATLTDSFQLPAKGPSIVRLTTVFERALARERDERYSSSKEMQDQMVPAISAVPEGLIPLPERWNPVPTKITLKIP
ncbi:MAG: serine/threonine protein kinase [Thermoanaerobaculia bacterium]|nr:serine/threonine protein kinase [Thermoanaerobaculia bacterium]